MSGIIQVWDKNSLELDKYPINSNPIKWIKEISPSNILILSSYTSNTDNYCHTTSEKLNLRILNLITSEITLVEGLSSYVMSVKEYSNEEFLITLGLSDEDDMSDNNHPVYLDEIYIWNISTKSFKISSKVIENIYDDEYIDQSILNINNDILLWSNPHDYEYNYIYGYDGGSSTMTLFNRLGNNKIILTGHSNWIIDVILLSNKAILSWSKDLTLRIWNTNNNESIVLKGHSDYILGAIEINNQYILSWSKDKTIRLWDFQGNCLSINVYEVHMDIKVTSINTKVIIDNNFFKIENQRKTRCKIKQ